MTRDQFCEIVKALPDEEFDHLAVVAHDISRRLPGSAFAELGEACRDHLGLPEPVPEPEPIPFVPSPNDVTVQL